MATKKNLAWLTAREDKAWIEAYQYWSDPYRKKSKRKADELAWRDMQKDFPRLKKFDGCHRGVKVTVAKELGSSHELAKAIVDGYPFGGELVVVADDLTMETLREAVDAPDFGDTLFRFIVIEISEGAVDDKGKVTAKGIERMLYRAKVDIASTMSHIYKLQIKHNRPKKKGTK
jgi:hypothetical protein